MSDATLEPLGRQHRIDEFDSGVESLDTWLRRYARVADAAGTARTYVLGESGRVLGYYALAPGQVQRGELPPRHAQGMPRHPVGVILLARLAVARGEQGRGYGRMLVHASTDDAARFYRRLGPTVSPTDPLHLMVLMKDLRKTFGVT